MLGTKWPSMTSTWSQSAPAAITARTSSARRPKSAESNDGAIVRRTAGAEAGGGRPRRLGAAGLRATADADGVEGVEAVAVGECSKRAGGVDESGGRRGEIARGVLALEVGMVREPALDYALVLVARDRA